MYLQGTVTQPYPTFSPESSAAYNSPYLLLPFLENAFHRTYEGPVPSPSSRQRGQRCFERFSTSPRLIIQYDGLNWTANANRGNPEETWCLSPLEEWKGK